MGKGCFQIFMEMYNYSADGIKLIGNKYQAQPGTVERTAEDIRIRKQKN